MLKSTTGWEDYYGESGNGTDALGFSALPAGSRYESARFYSEGEVASFWGATEDYDERNARPLVLYHNDEKAWLNSWYKHRGVSVRCVKD